MQQYSSLPEKNLQVDETPTLSLTVPQLRAELLLERGLNKLQSRFNECLVSAVNQNLQPSGETEAEIFQVVVDELSDVLNSSQLAIHSLGVSSQIATIPDQVKVAIALSQIGETKSKIAYISSSLELNSPSSPLMLKSKQKLYFQLEEIIDLEDLQSLTMQEPPAAFPIAVGSENILGWLIVASRPHIVNDENLADASKDVNNKLPQFIQQAIERCVAALTQIRQTQSLQQVCQHLESFNQELQRTNQIKNQFLANTSHEIRTPLSSILGFTHLLSVQGFEPNRARHQEYLNIIQSSGKHLLALINDILDLSKIEANQMEVQLEAVDLPVLCRTVFALVKEKAANKGLQMRLELEPDVTTLTADSLRLKQMLLNLLFNALKFTQKGTVGLQVKHHNGFVHFVVWDTGTGIPKEHQCELFQPYSQIANALVGRDEGTGLGLAVTRKLAELHGGYVEVESEVNQGSRFTVVLPLYPGGELLAESVKKAEDIENQNADCSEDSSNPHIYLSLPPLISPAHSPKILLVEDDLLNAQLMQTYLGKLGYQVTWVKNAAEMWQSLSAQYPAIILMDIYLSDGNGLNLIKQLREHKEYQDIIVIAQTAMAMKGDREICLNAGFDEYICKPIDLPLLATLVAKYSQVGNLG
ncbi:hybrid histidine kinase/response regulator HrmK [Calothrix sp. UHCC 0171]|uniref:hybrid histidine kinase/response regulator HrmK n=1 Tax=Calothrix sp. UHCC 0171 TaxID=3110245 RepID=UPI002B216931|nr:hybrid histidine kinase/response regulator HrmK [Calothrix sp. UHCC 0171]MEA5570846.1 hybrid histidine kinase/response regulator HrmK [Calothrix sp. UHCC 0171]